jgi:hypothetical protein
MAQAGGRLPVFVVLRSQPHKAILERVEGPARLRLEALESRYKDMLRNRPSASEAELREAQTEWEDAARDTRRVAFEQIAAEIGPEQDTIERLLMQLGATDIHRYTAINMLAAEVPATALDALAADPAVTGISLVETGSVNGGPDGTGGDVFEYGPPTLVDGGSEAHGGVLILAVAGIGIWLLMRGRKG